MITVRPNLNTGKSTPPQSTIHEGRLGRKLDSVAVITFHCNDVVIRPSGEMKARHGEKTVYAGLIGEINEKGIILPSKEDPQVEYNPHIGDRHFHINGVPYYGGGTITAVGHKYYKVG